jgi:quercetin dioxygenase-like cupin family protein
MSEKYVLVENLRDHAPLAERSILSRTIQNDDRTKAIQFCFAPGQELSAHTAPMPAMLYFVSGQATLRLGEDTMEVSEGAFVSMTPYLEHGIKAHGEVVMLLVMVKNPPAV